jgi:hypothetical protein
LDVKIISEQNSAACLPVSVFSIATPFFYLFCFIFIFLFIFYLFFILFFYFYLLMKNLRQGASFFKKKALARNFYFSFFNKNLVLRTSIFGENISLLSQRQRPGAAPPVARATLIARAKPAGCR